MKSTINYNEASKLKQLEAGNIRKFSIVWASGFTASAIIFIIIARLVSTGESIKLDRIVSEAFVTIHNDSWTSLFRFISSLGSTVGIIVMTIVLTILFMWQRSVVKALPIIGGVLLAYVLNTVIKNGFDRARPLDAWGIIADGASFPSANAMLAVVLYGLAAIIYSREAGLSRSAKLSAAGAAVTLTLLMGISRLYFEVHYATDIIGGYAAGFAVLCLVMLLLQTSWLKSRMS